MTKNKTALKLQSCPLCGREMAHARNFMLGWHWVRCPTRDSHSVEGPSRKTKRGAVNAFNRMVDKQREAQR